MEDAVSHSGRQIPLKCWVKTPKLCEISPTINRKLGLECPCGIALQPSSPWLEAFVF